MERLRAAHAGPVGIAYPDETYEILRITGERVIRGKPTFRIVQYVGALLTPGEWAQIESEVRAAAARKPEEVPLVGRPSAMSERDARPDAMAHGRLCRFGGSARRGELQGTRLRVVDRAPNRAGIASPDKSGVVTGGIWAFKGILLLFGRHSGSLLTGWFFRIRGLHALG